MDAIFSMLKIGNSAGNQVGAREIKMNNKKNKQIQEAIDLLASMSNAVDALIEYTIPGNQIRNGKPISEGMSDRVRASWESPLSEPLYKMMEESIEASGITGLGKMWEYDRILVEDVDQWFALGHFGEDREEFERAKMEVFQYVKAMFP